MSGLVLVAIAYFALAGTVFGPSNAEIARENGDRLVHLTIHSRAVGEDLGVNVIVPPPLWPAGQARALGLPAWSRGR